MDSKASLDMLRTLATRAISAFFQANGEGKPTEFTGWMELTGQSFEEMRNFGWLTVVHEDDQERARAAWQTAIAHGTDYNTEFRVRVREGSYRWFNARAVAKFDENGEVASWVGMILPLPGAMRHSSEGAARREAETIAPGALRAARAALNWSAEALASNAGISRSTVRRMENEDEAASIHRNTAALVIEALRLGGLELLVQDGVVNGVRLGKSDAPQTNVLQFRGKDEAAG